MNGTRYGVVQADDELIINDDWQVCRFALHNAMLLRHCYSQIVGAVFELVVEKSRVRARSSLRFTTVESPVQLALGEVVVNQLRARAIIIFPPFPDVLTTEPK
jgi:hypothetical protein